MGPQGGILVCVSQDSVVGQVREYFDVPLYKGECSSLFC